MTPPQTPQPLKHDMPTAGAPTRRRLLAKCPTGYEYHMGAVGGASQILHQSTIGATPQNWT
jgi:hypothetical protein